jgi:hypothetical protein
LRIDGCLIFLIARRVWAKVTIFFGFVPFIICPPFLLLF